jgi:hypothetical protein
MASTMLVTASTTLAMAPTTPTTRRPLPRYKGRTIDNTNLIEAIDQVGHKLSQTLTLVDSIQNLSTEQVPLHHNRSTRPVRARRPTRLGTRIVHLICSWVPWSKTMFQICTSSIYFDHHQATPSTWLVFRSIMKVWFIHCPRMATPALDLHDLFTPRTMNMVWIHYRTLRVSLRSQGSHQDVATWCSTSAMTSL